MVVKGGKHRLVGYVDLGPVHDDMRALEGRHCCPWLLWKTICTLCMFSEIESSIFIFISLQVSHIFWCFVFLP